LSPTETIGVDFGAQCPDCHTFTPPGGIPVWPAALTARGYRLEELGDGERIIATAIREVMTINRDGSLVPMTPNSTQATTLVTHHPGR
jgi:hypothetical protein